MPVYGRQWNQACLLVGCNHIRTFLCQLLSSSLPVKMSLSTSLFTDSLPRLQPILQTLALILH